MELMEDYSSMQVHELKFELRRRGASTRGKRSDLLERLEQYENYNFLTPQLSQISDPVIILPPDDSYHNINNNTKLPPIEKEHIRYYFERFNKNLGPSEKLYESRFLLMARSVALNGFYYIRGYVKKTMKKLQYQVDVKLDESGSIEECHCECPAGAGTEAHCKHVGVLLLAIHHVHKDKIILTTESQTQLLQSFHKPKKAYGGTPIKAQNLPSKKNKSIIFSPYPIETIDKRNYNNRFRNLILNSKSTMPLKQLYEPANPIALQQDHDYLKSSQEDQLLQILKLSQLI